MRIRSWTACAVVAAAVAGAPASAAAETVTFTTPVVGPVFNECTGETVFIDGTMHHKVTGSVSLTGTKYQLASNLAGVTGTTLTGARYVMSDQTSAMEHAEFDPSGNLQTTITQSTVLNRQGETDGLVAGDDFQLHVITHLTISNGVPRAEKNELRADCR